MADFARALPFAREIFASLDKAPKDMWDTYTGFSSTSGFFARGPITVVVSTGASSSSGMGSSWAPRIRISSQEGMGSCVPMAAETDFPLTAIW